MNKSIFIEEVTVIDPQDKLPVEVSMFKHENGGIFGVDSSYISQVLTDDTTPFVNDPLEPNALVLLKDV